MVKEAKDREAFIEHNQEPEAVPLFLMMAEAHGKDCRRLEEGKQGLLPTLTQIYQQDTGLRTLSFKSILSPLFWSLSGKQMGAWIEKRMKQDG